MDANLFAISAADKIPPTAVLRNVRFTYQTDSDGNRTNVIESVRYDCVDPSNYASFTLKVNGSKAVITPEELENAEDVIFIDIPTESTIIKPYALEYGKAKVSIITPMVKIHKQ
jgi:hypothetical protein